MVGQPQTMDYGIPLPSLGQKEEGKEMEPGTTARITALHWDGQEEMCDCFPLLPFDVLLGPLTG